MRDLRKENYDFQQIAYDLINTEPELEYIKDSQVRIGYLESEAAPATDGMLTFGRCEKTQDKHLWAIGYDFTITVFLPNAERFTRQQLRILLFHELLHIGIEKVDDDEERYYIRKHDLQDFRTIIERFGADWAEE